MFLCKECGKKYRIKPNYCDCGNDTFDEIKRIPDASVFFLIGCILLSIVILMTPINIESSKTVEKNKPKESLSKTNIPNIDKFWNNTPPVIQPSNTQEVFTKTEAKKVVSQPKIMTQTKVKSAHVRNTKKAEKAKTLQKPQQKAEKKAKVTPKKPIKAADKSKPVQNVLKKQKTIAPAQTTPTVTAKDTEALYRYKLGLRQALFANLSVASIQGRGKCGIEFSLDKNGKLINRAFSFQSDNRSVNDEVYKMLMKMPKYYAPPKAYNGEKIKLVLEFNNGSYIINYAN